jgi:catechol 2,3-dioxygenase-like lactoylglutathione lyase family enzyme
MLADHRVHTTIPAADLERAKAWYAEKLGLTPVREIPTGVFYDAGEGTRFVLYPTPNAGQAPTTLMGFTTDDLEGDVAALKARGVVFEEYDYPTLKTVDGIATRGEIKSAWFKDSEGNILAVVHFGFPA